ncbi:MAG: carbohydrate kinase family protein [Limisphaerales bacterium]
MTNAPILCFGEILWDSLPQGLFPGGAPINVAYHLKQLGRRAIPVTAVGKDYLGEELLLRMKRWGLETDFASVLPDKRTGAVQVELNDKGSATYKILEDVAWDWIQVTPALEELAKQSSALVYGTLAQRSEHNRKQLFRLMDQSPEAMKVYDVNLRPPYDSHELVWELSERADLIKLNDDEIAELLKRSLEKGDLESGARDLARRTKTKTVCVTAGADGAGLLVEDKWFWADGEPVKVKDTIGAGDSFLAGLVNGLIGRDTEHQEVLRRAARLAEFVASSDGATPNYLVSNDGSIRRS